MCCIASVSIPRVHGVARERGIIPIRSILVISLSVVFVEICAACIQHRLVSRNL